MERSDPNRGADRRREETGDRDGRWGNDERRRQGHRRGQRRKGNLGGREVGCGRAPDGAKITARREGVVDRLAGGVASGLVVFHRHPRRHRCHAEGVPQRHCGGPGQQAQRNGGGSGALQPAGPAGSGQRGSSMETSATTRDRGGRIRTDDFLLPKQALYRAELRPATGVNGKRGTGNGKGDDQPCSSAAVSAAKARPR